MTIIKTMGVSSPAHVASLKAYLEDGRALARETRNVVDPERAFDEMERTRHAYGHDVAAREGCRNTLMWHQVIGFLPEEADFNGGTMTAERCMDFAREWLETRYPDQEAVFALHREGCAADGTERYAVHVAMNRTMLDGSGRRLDEGPARVAKATRAKAMRAMDARWGLSQVRANERNSRIHARQPSRAEREMTSRGMTPEKERIRECVKTRVREVRDGPSAGNKMRELSRRVQADGIRMTVSKSGRQLKFESHGLVVNGEKLGRGFSMAGIARGLGTDAARSAARQAERDEGMDR
ncbi:MAG: relaxase/mobilization nuclease domain-containing protein [Coriobacteriia bacterium]|nr:relaxase/mobilization nuclease domain-containing protein [Coriobacteriia bacterium]